MLKMPIYLLIRYLSFNVELASRGLNKTVKMPTAATISEKKWYIFFGGRKWPLPWQTLVSINLDKFDLDFCFTLWLSFLHNTVHISSIYQLPRLASGTAKIQSTLTFT